MKYISSVIKLFWVSRPISWPNTSYPFFVGFILALGGAPNGINLATLIIGTIYFLGPFNLLMYGLNDVYDYESDIRNPRKGGVEGMKESRAFHPTIVRAVILINAPFLLYLLIIGGWEARAALVAVVFAAIAYSLKGLRFKEIPVLDSVTSSLHFIGPLLVALAFVGAPATAWPWVAAFFLWGMASHALGAVQDIVPDREGNIKSIATSLGARATVWLSTILYVLATYITLTQGWPYWIIAVAGIPYIANCLPYLSLSDKNSTKANTAWRHFLWLNYLSGALITIVIITAHLN